MSYTLILAALSTWSGSMFLHIGRASAMSDGYVIWFRGYVTQTVSFPLNIAYSLLAVQLQRCCI